MNFRNKVEALSEEVFTLGELRIAPIRDDWDLWYATVECRLKPGQEEYVNSAGFSIGRAWLHPDRNLPCIIWNGDTRIGYICLRYWPRETPNTDWSYYLDAQQQGMGYGRAAAQIAVNILKTALPEIPIKLSVEQNNEKGQNLYASLGFVHNGEMDGDDMVMELR